MTPHFLCFSETGVIGDAPVRLPGRQSSAGRLSVGGSLSLSRFCSFFGSWSRSRRASSARLPPHPRLFVVGEDGASLRSDFVWLAAEGRPKPPLVLDRQVKRAVNLFFVIVLSVCVLGRGCSPLPVTLSLVPSREGLRVAEALRGRVPSPASTQLDIQYNQGVSAVIFSDHRLAHHPESDTSKRCQIDEGIQVPRVPRLEDSETHGSLCGSCPVKSAGLKSTPPNSTRTHTGHTRSAPHAWATHSRSVAPPLRPRGSRSSCCCC